MTLTQNEIKTILFDLDGTLIDNFEAIYMCYVHTSKVLNIVPVDYETFKYSVGGSLAVTLGQFMNEALVPEALEIFKEHSKHVIMHGTSVLPGAHWLLTQLQSFPYKISIFTNKSGPSARQICKGLEIDHLVHDIIGVGDVPEYKPHPEFTRSALERLEADPETTILIGDSTYDVDAAHNYGLKCYIMTTGTHTYEELAKHPQKPHGIFKNCYELGQHLFNFTPPEPIL